MTVYKILKPCIRNVIWHTEAGASVPFIWPNFTQTKRVYLAETIIKTNNCRAKVSGPETRVISGYKRLGKLDGPEEPTSGVSK